MNVHKKTLVKEIMSTELTTADTEDNLHIVEQKLKTNKIHHLPVLSDGKIVGIISHGDLLVLKDWGTFLNLKKSQSMNETIFRTHTAEDIMSKDVVTIDEGYTIEQVAALMKSNIVHAFPVTKEEELVGIITTYDIIQKTFN